MNSKVEAFREQMRDVGAVSGCDHVADGHCANPHALA
jgi:hypothetical protein